MSLEKAAEKLRRIALEYPETFEEAPWGDRVVKVRGKIFFSAGASAKEKTLHVTAKLPLSGKAMLQRPNAEPTHYGMGKYGWVTFTYGSAAQVSERDVRAWIDESFRAVAPPKLVDQLDSGGGAAPKPAAKAAKARSAGAAKSATAARSAKTKAAPKAAAKSATAKSVAKSTAAMSAATRATTATLAAAKAKAATRAGVQSEAPAAVATTKAARTRARATLVCSDPLRAQRAVEALAARNITIDVVPTAEAVELRRVKALIVDVGRNPREGLLLAEQVDASDHPIHLFVTGVRDAAQERALAKLGSAETFRDPPGDDAVVAAVAGVLLGHIS